MIKRVIKKREYDFLIRVEKAVRKDFHAIGLSPETMVEEMDDGGMGSLRFPLVSDKDLNRRLGSIAAEGEFSDEDGIPVKFSINLDSNGRLFELDIWRVDFEPLKRFPTEKDEIKMISDPKQTG